MSFISSEALCELIVCLFGNSGNALKSLNALPYSAHQVVVKKLSSCIEVSATDTGLSLNLPKSKVDLILREAERTLISHDGISSLLRCGASKGMITSILGVPESEIQSRRMSIETTSDRLPSIGRPRKLDQGEKDMLIKMWSNAKGSDTNRIILVHRSSGIPINDCWLVIKAYKTGKGYDSKFSNSLAI